MSDAAHARLRAVVRLLIGALFLLFAEYKIVAPTAFAGQMPGWLDPAHCYPVLRPFLVQVLLPHTPIFAWLVAILESAIGLGLLMGIAIRPLSWVGAGYMMLLGLARGYTPQAPLWRAFGVNLDHLGLLLLFVLIATESHPLWTLDGVLERRRNGRDRRPPRS